MTGEAILLSIRPKFAEQIFNGTKTVELRRVRPKKIGKGSLVFVYVSSPVQALMGGFRVKSVEEHPLSDIWELVKNEAGISKTEFDTYYHGNTTGVAIFIDEKWSLQKPVGLHNLREQRPNFHPPQSFRYPARNKDDVALISEFMEDYSPFPKQLEFEFDQTNS
ncbi:ASCH domain-containing protein [Anaerolineales bacterium HSG6]|nr:ASCH domain-containing protein [Anaerolineales bacterium HSG6]